MNTLIDEIAKELADKRYYERRVRIDPPTWKDCYTEAKSELLQAILEAIGDDEFHIDKSFGTERKVVLSHQIHRNELRQEIRTKFKKLFGEETE